MKIGAKCFIKGFVKVKLTTTDCSSTIFLFSLTYYYTERALVHLLNQQQEQEQQQQQQKLPWNTTTIALSIKWQRNIETILCLEGPISMSWDLFCKTVVAYSWFWWSTNYIKVDKRYRHLINLLRPVHIWIWQNLYQLWKWVCWCERIKC